MRSIRLQVTVTNHRVPGKVCNVTSNSCGGRELAEGTTNGELGCKLRGQTTNG